MQRLPIVLGLGLGLIIGASASLAVAQPSPDITVRQDDNRTLKEYRVNGELYAIEIVPRQGASIGRTNGLCRVSNCSRSLVGGRVSRVRQAMWAWRATQSRRFRPWVSCQGAFS